MKVHLFYTDLVMFVSFGMCLFLNIFLFLFFFPMGFTSEALTVK